MAKRILILDTPHHELGELAETFRKAAGKGCVVELQTRAEKLLELVRRGEPCDIVVVDYVLGDGKRGGRRVLNDIRRAGSEVPVVAVAEKGDVESAAEAIRAGAVDFLVRGKRLPERVSTLLGKVEKLLQLAEHNRLLRSRNLDLEQAEHAKYQIFGDSPQTRNMLAQLERVAAIPRPVLIVGERGTGKELVARAIHLAAGAPGRPMVVVNCAAFPDTLLESELFGHEKGSFTGADRTVPGKFELARGGTLFLDEIGNMSLSFQQQILRVVEYGVFTRVGGTTELQTDARIIAATNSDLKAKMKTGEFLRDLYDRLSFEVIQVAPLRERAGDIELLAQHFLRGFMREIPALQGKQLAGSALSVLRRYHFPGNVRELKNIIERAAYRDTTNEITPEDIGMLPEGESGIRGGNFAEKVEGYKKRLVEEALRRADDNQAQAARLLGLSYHQFRYFHRKYSS